MQDTKDNRDEEKKSTEGDFSRPWFTLNMEDPGRFHKTHKLITIKLPICVPDENENISEYLRTRLRLIKLYDFLDVKSLISLYEKKKSGIDCSNEISKLAKSFTLQINDFDKTELIVSGLRNRKISDKTREMIIPRYGHVEMFKHEEGFLEHESKYVMHRVALLALPRIRAKIAVLEVLYVLNPTWDFYCELVTLCPLFIKSPRTARNLHHLRELISYGDPNESKKAKKYLTKLQKALAGQTKRQERKLSYFVIHQEFKDMVAMFERYTEARKTKSDLIEAEENLRIFAEIYNISDDRIKRVKSERSKPAQHALEALIEKGFIKSEVTYRNKVKRYMNELFKLYPDLEFDWSFVRRFIDIAALHPDSFSGVDIWSQLEDFKMADPKEFNGAYPILANWV